MTAIDEIEQWEEEVTVIATTDALLGGPNGPLNRAARQLANRLQWLRSRAPSRDVAINVAASTYNLSGDEWKRGVIKIASSVASAAVVAPEPIAGDARTKTFRNASANAVTIRTPLNTSSFVLSVGETVSLSFERVDGTTTAVYPTGMPSTSGLLSKLRGGWGSDISSATGIAKLVGGVLSWLTIPNGELVGTTHEQPLTSKTIDLALNTVTSSTANNGDVVLYGANGTPLAAASVASQTHRLVNKLARGAEDAALLILGDSTSAQSSGWAYRMAQIIAARYPTHTVIYHLWDTTGGAAYDTGDAGSATTLQTGTGPRTLHIWNCSVGGSGTTYAVGTRWPAAVGAITPDLILVSYGHNEGTSVANYTATQWRMAMLQLTESLTLEHPYAGMILILQNPETANTDQAIRARVYEDVAALRGYGVIDAHQAFVDTGNVPGYTADGIHPNTAGYQLWATVVAKALFRNSIGAIASKPRSSLTPPEQLLANANLASFASPPALTGWTASNATLTKDTTNFESRNGYAVRIQAASAAASRISQTFADYALFRGKWLTLCARIRIPAGQAQTSGRIQIFDGVNTNSVSRASQFARDGFHWIVVTMKVASNASELTIYIYGSTAADGAADVTVDRCSLVYGVLPMLAQ